MTPVRLQIGLYTNACFCLHEAGLKNYLMLVSLIPVAEPTRMTRTGLKSDHQIRWIFRDLMVEDLIEALEASKSEYEGRGLDFEGDLVKLYPKLCKAVSEKYEEIEFGPTAVSEPTKSIQETSKEEFKEHKTNADGQQKAIKLGYDIIKAKVKKLRSNFQKAVAEGTRSGSGRIMKDNWDALVAIWGGAPRAQPLEFGKSSIEDTDESHPGASEDISVEVIPSGSKATEDSEAMNEDEGTLPDSKKESLPQQDM